MEVIDVLEAECHSRFRLGVGLRSSDETSDSHKCYDGDASHE